LNLGNHCHGDSSKSSADWREPAYLGRQFSFSLGVAARQHFRSQVLHIRQAAMSAQHQAEVCLAAAAGLLKRLGSTADGATE
jgi:hypothetical protein